MESLGCLPSISHIEAWTNVFGGPTDSSLVYLSDSYQSYPSIKFALPSTTYIYSLLSFLFSSYNLVA